jgi:perosamine synthetase
MDPVLEVARKYKLHVVEDCAEAHGALYKGKPVGSLGTIGCFSFYANKIITTGEGGMLTTNNHALADRAASVKSLAFGKINKFMHSEIGYNYRMTNLQAAVGCGQMEKIDRIIEMKREIARQYHDRLQELPQLQLPVEKSYARNVYWMYHVVLREGAHAGRDTIMAKLAERGIETRPGFLPFNMQEIFIKRGLTKADACPVANFIGLNSFYVPSGPQIEADEIDFVCESLGSLL